jgi:hypothetical protein
VKEQAELSKLLKKYYIILMKVFQECMERRYQHPLSEAPPFPTECRGMTCGAETRAGTPCKRRDIYPGGRCKLHSGLSTGPKTIEGKKKSARNGFAPKKRRKKQSL